MCCYVTVCILPSSERTSLAQPAVVPSEYFTTITRNSDSTTPSSSGGYKKQPFGCGSGVCTLSSFIESGCPTPIPSVSSFPYLNLSGLTYEQQKDLKERLQLESQQIMMQFQELLSKTVKSLVRQNIPLDRLVSYVMTLRAHKPVFRVPQLPLFQYCFRKLKSVGTIPEVFLVLKDYFSFFNYRIIEYIIKTLGTAEDKAMLQKYKEKFDQYAKRRIFECPPESTRPAIDIETFVMLDSQYENYTVSEINAFGQKLIEILHLPSQGILHLYPGGGTFFVPGNGNSVQKPQLGIDASSKCKCIAYFCQSCIFACLFLVHGY